MTDSISRSMPAWHARPKVRQAAIVALAILAVIEGYLAIFVRENDFIFHRNLGLVFLTGKGYDAAGDWYPLARVMINAGPAALPLLVSRTLCYLLALAALAACYRMWREMADERWPAARSLSFAAATLSVLILIPLVLRDLDECGLQTFLLFFLTAGGYALWKGRHTRAGFWLATAASYKVTPVLCLPFLLWKREWRAAAWMVAFTGLWAIAPAAFLGWQGMVEAQTRFLARAREVSAAHNAYPSLLQFEPPKPQNLSLQSLFARYLETYPPGHPLYLEHPAFVQFGALDRETAYQTVRGLMLAFAAVIAWRCRRRFGPEDTQADVAPQWAAMCMLCAILAPLCWKQHLVVILPAMFLTLRSALIGQPAARLRWALLGFIAAVILLGRHAVGGREFSIVLMSYKIDTMAILLLLGLVLTIAPRGPACDRAQFEDDVLPDPALSPTAPRRAA